MIVKQIKTPKLPNCDADLHLRITKQFEEEIERIAISYRLKKSTFVRMVLMREMDKYDPVKSIVQ